MGFGELSAVSELRRGREVGGGASDEADKDPKHGGLCSSAKEEQVEGRDCCERGEERGGGEGAIEGIGECGSVLGVCCQG